MSYSIQAILATQGTFAAELANGMEVLQLDGGIEMIALGSTARKLLGLPFLPLTDEGIEELPPALRGLCSALSVHGPVAYVEAEIFGGSGTQAHTLIPAGGGQMRSYLFLTTPSIRHLNGLVFGLSMAKTGLIQLGLASIEKPIHGWSAPPPNVCFGAAPANDGSRPTADITFAYPAVARMEALGCC